MKVSDSHWHRQLSELGGSEGGQTTHDPYWLWPFENYATFCPYLVGSYERVASELRRYIESELSLVHPRHTCPRRRSCATSAWSSNALEAAAT